MSGLRSIAFVTPTAALGGAERALLDLAASLRAAAPALRLDALVGEDGPLVDALRGVGADAAVVPLPAALAALGEGGGGRRWLRLGRGAAASAGYLRRLATALADRAPDVVHTNGMKAHVLGALVGPPRPVIWHIRDLVGQRRLARRALRALRDRARGALAVSGLVARDLAACGVRLPTAVLHDAVDTDRFAPDPAGLAATPQGQRPLRIGLVATYSRWKGHRVFLEAAARLGGDARLVIVGGPIYRTEGSQLDEGTLRRWAAAAGVEERLELVPFQADLVPIYRGLDVVVHASTTPEPFGLTIAEALSCGRAVVAAADAGCVELLTPGRDLLVVPAGDPAALARALTALRDDAPRRAALGAAGRAVAVERLGRGRLGPALLAAYARLGATRAT